MFYCTNLTVFAYCWRTIFCLCANAAEKKWFCCPKIPKKKDAVSNEETNCNNETNETNRKYFATKIS